MLPPLPWDRFPFPVPGVFSLSTSTSLEDSLHFFSKGNYSVWGKILVRLQFTSFIFLISSFIALQTTRSFHPCRHAPLEYVCEAPLSKRWCLVCTLESTLDHRPGQHQEKWCKERTEVHLLIMAYSFFHDHKLVAEPRLACWMTSTMWPSSYPPTPPTPNAKPAHHHICLQSLWKPGVHNVQVSQGDTDQQILAQTSPISQHTVCWEDERLF